VSGAAKVPWATHAVAHVMEMQGRVDDGLAWLHERQGDWAEGNGFAGHHWWHLALFHLEAMDLQAAMAVHDAHLCGDQAPLTLQRLDAAALLWRIELLGGEGGGRWDDLAAAWDLASHRVGHSAFNDVHALLVRLGQGQLAQARALINAAAAHAASARDSNAAMSREIGLPLMRGLLALREGDAAAALALIAPIREPSHRFGGSHAQRDLIMQTLLCAAARAGDRQAGTLLLVERCRAKPHTALTAHWQGRIGVART
jgi:hypothetical protein